MLRDRDFYTFILNINLKKSKAKKLDQLEALIAGVI